MIQGFHKGEEMLEHIPTNIIDKKNSMLLPVIKKRLRHIHTHHIIISTYKT